MEGQDATNQLINFAQAETQPSVDAIQEVSIQTSNFAPEFGTVGGGFFNVTMRSGTNQFHGSGYDYFVNEVLNGGTPFTDDGHGNLIRPPARRNDVGGTLGGPVRIPKLYDGHDKTFFFFNWEQFAETQHINNIPISVPTAAYRSGDFSQAIAAVGGKVLGTDTLGRPLVENTIYDPTTARMVNGLTVTDPFPNNTVPLKRFRSRCAKGSGADSSADQLRASQQLPADVSERQIDNHSSSQAGPIDRRQGEAVFLLVGDSN